MLLALTLNPSPKVGRGILIFCRDDLSDQGRFTLINADERT